LGDNGLNDEAMKYIFTAFITARPNEVQLIDNESYYAARQPMIIISSDHS
jgi:hypothetical protein